MPGFLAASGYEGTERIDLDDIAPGYWVDVKRCLSSSEASLAEAKMIGNHKLGNAGQTANIDSRGYRAEMIVLSLVDWNLDEEDGVTRWPLGADLPAGRTIKPGENPYPPGCPRRQSVARLPEPVFGKIFAKVDELNSPRKGKEAAQFPGGDERGDPDGDESASGAGQVPDGAGVLEGTRAAV